MYALKSSEDASKRFFGQLLVLCSKNELFL